MEIGTTYDPRSGLEIRLHPCGDDDTAAIREAIQSLPSDQPCRLVLEKGEYNIHDESCFEIFCFVSNNSSGLKRVAFPILGRKNLIIDGQGSRLLFHGRACPFLIRDSHDIIIRNLSIDYSRPFVSQGIIEKVTPGGVDVRVEEIYPYFFEGGRIWFNGGRYDQRGLDTGRLFKRDSFIHCLEYDAERHETAFMAEDNYMVPASKISEIEQGLLHVDYALSSLPRVGNTLVLSHDHRDCFGVLIDESRYVMVEDVSFHHTGAMAIVAQRSEGLTLQGCVVAIEENSPRMVSSFADASHFTSCRGLIRIQGCRFENMRDDPVNVHGMYCPIRRILDSRTLEVGNGHFEQAGIQGVDEGTEVRFIDQHTLLPLANCGILSVEKINSYLWRVELDRPLADSVKAGDCIESMHWIPDVEIRDCRFGKNRARGPLITTAGQVIVENNHFHHAGSAIKICGDTNSWFESGAVRNVLIRGNTFDNCGYGVWGRGIIAIDPEIEPAGYRPEAYHRNINILDNQFNTFHEELVFARCVDGLTIQGNRVTKTDDYPKKDTAFSGLFTENCDNVDSQF